MIRSSFDITTHVRMCCSKRFTRAIECKAHSEIVARSCEMTVYFHIALDF